MLIIFALKDISQENFAEVHFNRIKEVLKSEPKDKILEDATLIPAWIRAIIEKCYE